MILVLFCVWDDARMWADWNYSLDIHLNYLGPVSKAQNPSSFSASWIPLWVHYRWVTALPDGLVPVELEWGATFFSLHPYFRDEEIKVQRI